MRKYITRTNSPPTIDTIYVVRETSSCVYISAEAGKALRRAKKTAFQVFHDTWEDAIEHLNKMTQAKARSALLKHNKAIAELNAIKKLIEPE